MKITHIHLYPDPAIIDLESIRQELQKLLPNCDVDKRKPFFEYLEDDALERLAEFFAYSEISDVKQPFEKQPERDRLILSANILRERSFIENPNTPIDGILYDGFVLQKLIRESISEIENSINHLHIVFTNRLVTTFSEDDWRYHARAVICGTPSIISASGIVEAPAKPKEFYYSQMRSFNDPSEMKRVEKMLAGRFIDYGDRRLTRLAMGYVLQAVFFFLNDGEPFCDDVDCRLYNSHWQQELIHSQIEIGRLCARHSKMLKGFT